MNNNNHDITSLQIREISKSILQKPSNKRNHNDIKILQMATSNIRFFEEILKEEGIQVLSKCLSRIQLEVYPESSIVFEKGDKGKDFYIILTGQVGIYIYSNDMESFQFNKITIRPSIRDQVNQLIESGVKPTSDHPLEIRKILVNEKIKKYNNLLKRLFKANELHEGDSFGERALINEAARLATVVCETACTFGVLNKQDYKEILLQAQSEKIQKQITELQSISSFSSISRRLLTILLYAFQSQEFKYREIVYKQGSENRQEIYLIQGGEFVIQQEVVKTTYNPLKINCQGTKQVAILTKGSIFGDKEAFLNQPYRTQTVRCNSDSGKVLCIHLQSLYQRLQANNELHLFNELKQQCEIKEQTRQIRIEKKQSSPKKSKSFIISNSPNAKIDNIIQHKKKIVKYLNKNEKGQAQFIFDIKIPRARTPGRNTKNEISFQQPRRSAIERVFQNSRVSKRASEDLTSQCNRLASKRYSFL